MTTHTPTLDELELSNPPHARYVRELFASIDEEVRLTGAGYSRRDAFRLVIEDRVLRGIVHAGDVEHRSLLELAGIPA